MIEINGKFTSAKIMIDNIEPEVMSQSVAVTNHPIFKNRQIRIMPDCHAGKGCVIGFTSEIDLKDPKIIPNLIGVDIGCGVVAINVNNRSMLLLEEINDRIIRHIPMGFNVNSKAKFKLGADYKALCEKIEMNFNRAELSVGTLGGGNHYIELGVDSKSNMWLTVHTGSRNLGKCICDYHQKKAFKHISKIASVPVEEFKMKYSGEELGRRIEEFNRNKPKVDKDLCYLEGSDAEEYLNDMKLAQKYAALNRKYIVSIITDACGFEIDDMIESVHNYIDFDDGILRKGAIRSYENERMIIPLNMRDGFLICSGKSNQDWNCSAPHGAGRIMSRSEAKISLSLDDYKKSMSGIYSTCVEMDTIDESPMAYKDASVIKGAIQDTASILETVKPVLNIKAGG